VFLLNLCHCLCEWNGFVSRGFRGIVGSDVIEFFQIFQYLLVLLQIKKNTDSVSFVVGHILLLQGGHSINLLPLPIIPLRETRTIADNAVSVALMAVAGGSGSEWMSAEMLTFREEQSKDQKSGDRTLTQLSFHVFSYHSFCKSNE
jgi:hypothetical protein